MLQPLWKSAAGPPKVKHRVTLDSAILLLGVHPRELKAHDHTTCARMFTAAIFITAKSGNTQIAII